MTTFWVVLADICIWFVLVTVISATRVGADRRSAQSRFQPVEYHPVGPVSGFNVGRLTREYIDREDMDGYDFERRLDEFVENCTLGPYGIKLLGDFSSNGAPLYLDDVTLIQASAAVACQSSAGVIPPGMSPYADAQQLRDAAFAPTAIYAVGHEEPVDFIRPSPFSRCRCGALDSPNHRVMCWQADRAPAYAPLPLEEGH